MIASPVVELDVVLDSAVAVVPAVFVFAAVVVVHVVVAAVVSVSAVVAVAAAVVVAGRALHCGGRISRRGSAVGDPTEIFWHQGLNRAGQPALFSSWSSCDAAVSLLEIKAGGLKCSSGES